MLRSLRFAAVGLAATGLGLGAGPALAGGSLKDAPVPGVVYDWNGLSVGVGIGVGKFDQDVDAKAWRHDTLFKKKCYESVPEIAFVLSSESADCDPFKKIGEKDNYLSAHANDDDWKWFGTLQVGYDRLLGDRFLIGAFADYDFYGDSDISFSKSKFYGKDSLTGSVDRDHIWSVGGRLGFLVTPRVLFYGLAAYSQMSLDGSLNAKFHDPYWKGNPTNLSLRVDDNVGGYSVGGGVEAKLDRRLSLKIEYRFSHFDGASGKVTDSDTDYWKKDCYYGCDFKVFKRELTEGAKLDLGDTDVHSIRAVLSFKLGDIHDRRPEPLK
jgi:opacity protein-like surface antigen